MDTTIDEHSRTPDPADATLILDWKNHGPTIVGLLDQHLPAGSKLTIGAPHLPRFHAARFGALVNITVANVQAGSTERGEFAALQPEAFQHVIVLAVDDVTSDRADARTLVMLLLDLLPGLAG